MPFPPMGPGAARPPRSPLDEALEALMAQQPEQGPSRMGGPPSAGRAPSEAIALPPLPPAPNLQGAGPQLPTPPPPFNDWRAGMAMGDEIELPPPSPFANVTRANAMQGLSGLQAAQSDQFSPFGEMELSQLANRDPNMVAPGSNQMWAGKLQEMRGNRLRADDVQRKALEGIQGAIQGTHPAVQFQAEQDARRKAMPASITAQGQFRAAEEAANSRRDVAEAGLEGREINARHGSLDMIMQAIRAMRAKQGGLQDDDATQLKALENLYDALSDELDLGATFADARGLE